MEVKCPKCESEMISGFILDRAHLNSKLEGVWVEGSAESSFWDNGIKTSGKNIYKFQAFRCTKCSYLEFYTTEKVTN